MKDLRTIRIFLSTLFFIGALAYLVVSPTIHPMAKVVEKVQIVPSLIATGMGTIIIWLGITFVFGRIYCSTVCPVGTLQDIVIPLRRFIPGLRRPFSYKKPRGVRYHILIIYGVCLVLGAVAVSFWIEPWNMMRNICGAINPTRAQEAWLTLGIGMGAGMAAGLISALSIAICALMTGRGFCNTVCPVGTALGCFHDFTLYHIEIDPDKCVNCMKCEEVCKSQCVKVVGRHVDNSRCVRCFDCLKVCPNDAIRYQWNRNLRATPLIRKVKTR
ncbi:MAG: 4Fe-4S binding protein [Muribaculaceae bacterium]|nr:4Fe-4S binding protein [Muribaculaceae bacterium]